jgi:hypothetical protein
MDFKVLETMPGYYYQEMSHQNLMETVPVSKMEMHSTLTQLTAQETSLHSLAMQASNLRRLCHAHLKV